MYNVTETTLVMPFKKLPKSNKQMEVIMRLEKGEIKKILELRIKGNTIKGIARNLGISKNTSKRSSFI